MHLMSLVLELVITKIEADENFSLNISVSKWKSLTVGPTCYSIGLSKNSLVLLQSTLDPSRNKFNITSKVIGNYFHTIRKTLKSISMYTIADFQKNPSDFILFHNRNNGVSEVMSIVTFYDDPILHWFNLKNLTLVSIIL